MEQYLKFFVFKFQRLYIDSNNYPYASHWFQYLFCMKKSSTPPLILDICGLKFVTSTLFIDNTAARFCLPCL